MTRFRAELEECYFYIDNNLDVVLTFERRSLRDTSRFVRGNYFKTSAEATKLSRRFRAMLKRHHSQKGGKA